jgi:hypothetical protein
MIHLIAESKDELIAKIEKAEQECNTDTHMLIMVRILCTKDKYEAQLRLIEREAF